MTLMRVPSVAYRAPARGAGVVPDLVDVVAPLGRAVAAAGLLPWRPHRADSDGAELKQQYSAVVVADGAGLAGAHRQGKAAVEESVLVRTQEGANGAIDPEEVRTEMKKHLPGVVLNGWVAARGIRSTKLYCESEVEQGCAKAAKAMKIEVEAEVASEEGSERE